jgi:hypothetical protein
MQRCLEPVIAGCILFLLVSSASAFSVGSVSVTPSGYLNPGDPVNVSCTVYVASGTAFSTYDELQFITGLDDPYWKYTIEVNGAQNTRPVTKGKTLTISGFELKYRDDDEVTVEVQLLGTVPSGAALGTNVTVLRIQELNSRGTPISYSVVTVDRLVGEPTPPPTAAFGSITATSSPAGANIYIDNVYKGVSPAVFTGIPNGDHVVLFRMDGYGDVKKTVRVTADNQTVDASLGSGSAGTVLVTEVRTVAPVSGSPTVTGAAPGTGSLSVTTVPPGALVYVDGTIKGITPTTIPMLSAGSHEVVLILDGYEDLKTTIVITEGATAEYSTGMSKAPQTPGFGAGILTLALGILLVIRKRNA